MARRRKPVVVVNLGGGGKASKRKRRSRGYAGAAVWLAVAALFEVIGVVLQITSLILVGLVALAGSIISAIINHHRRKHGHTPAPTPAPSANPTKNGGSSPSGPRRTRKPVAGQKARACSRACQVSSKPRDTCDCRCGGANHGRYAGRTPPPNPRKTNPNTTGSGSAGNASGGSGGGGTATRTQPSPTSRKANERRCGKCGRTVPTTRSGGLMSHNCKVQAFRSGRRHTL